MEQLSVSVQEKTMLSTELLRKKIREYSLSDRANSRATSKDALRFGLGEIKAHIDELSFTEKDVNGLAGRIKRRKHATQEDMYRLSHAFLLSNENINAFSNTTGALQVLIKELTSTKSERQIYAVECICNLSLGEPHVSDKIVNICGSYLVTYLDSSEKRLKQTSLWTLTNLIAADGKSAETLLKMELLRKLWSIYVGIEDIEYYEDAAICLQLLCLKTAHLLNESHYKFIIEKMMQKGPTSLGSEYLLQIIFNCDLLNARNHGNLEEPVLVWLVNFALNSLYCSTDISVISNRLKIVYSIRIISNSLASNFNVFHILKRLLSDHCSSSLSSFFEYLFKFEEKELIFEILWLLRNVLEAASQCNEDPVELEGFLTSIRLPQTVSNVIL